MGDGTSYYLVPKARMAELWACTTISKAFFPLYKSYFYYFLFFYNRTRVFAACNIFLVDL
jgi:hypothetical protein